MPMEMDEVVKNADEKAGGDGQTASIVPDEGAIDKADGKTGTGTDGGSSTAGGTGGGVGGGGGDTTGGGGGRGGGSLN